MRVLFICTGNSCRSIMAEALFNALAPGGWQARSGGTQPTGAVNRRTLQLLQRENVDTTDLRSKSWDSQRWRPDIVITLCPHAAGEIGSLSAGPMLRSYWGLPDPAAATGSDEAIEAVFERVYRQLRARIEAFMALPLDVLQHDKPGLQCGLDQIAASFSSEHPPG